ncbi:YdhK family protein [Bacillus daqingensis]|uniref:YdhK family protein n=2 Tax=Bacillaceae TaxID=186817 RepID=A0A969PXL4_9BACI|nr:YdhK family protein [Alkalicoccus luteus]NJP37472.1 YdhK family protein [Alkalicoccus luteus]
MRKNKMTLGSLPLLAAVLLMGCADEESPINESEEPQNSETDATGEEEMNMNSESNSEEEMNHSEMDHSAEEMSSSGEVPEGLEEAENSTYEVGSQAIIQADHMQGMTDAEATISGAFDTTVYTVSYIPTDGGEPVEDHKWVIHEEFVDTESAPLDAGTEVILDAEHMEGMDGAEATIDTAEETTVYMVDFVMTDTQEEVSNHKWVTESELAAGE